MKQQQHREVDQLQARRDRDKIHNAKALSTLFVLVVAIAVWDATSNAVHGWIIALATVLVLSFFIFLAGRRYNKREYDTQEQNQH